MGFISISAAQAAKRTKEHGHTRLPRFAGYIPNWEENEKEAESELYFILNGLTSVHKTAKGDSAQMIYYYRLQKYIDRHHHRYSRQIHLNLIKLVYSAICHPKIPTRSASEAVKALIALIRDARLTRNDLELPWKPLLDLIHSIAFGKNEKFAFHEICLVGEKVKKFFPADSTKGIWDELAHYRSISPDELTNYMRVCLAFLPVNLTVDQHQQFGATIWFKELWHLHEVAENFCDYYSDSILFGKLQKHCPGFVNWSPMYDRIFTELIRSMNMPSRGRDKATPQALENNEGSFRMTDLIVYTYGLPNGCDDHLFRFFDYMAQEMHPFYEGDHSLNAISVFQSLMRGFVNRYRREYVKPIKDRIPEDKKLTKEKLRLLVSKLLPIIMPALYAEMNSWDVPSMVAKLSLFAPELVIPKILQSLYPAIGHLSEPNRLIQTLRCIAHIIIPLSQGTFDVGEIRKEKKIISEESGTVEEDPDSIIPSQSARTHLITILDQVVDLIDVNQLQRTKEICNILSYVFNAIPCVDCTQFASLNSLTMEERKLAARTGSMMRIVDRAIDKIFGMIEVICTPIPGNSTEVIGSLRDAKDNDNYTNYEDIFVDGCTFTCLEAMACSGDRRVREKIANRLCTLVLSTSHEHVNAARIYSSIIAFLVKFCPEKWSVLFNTVYARMNSYLDENARKNPNLDNHVLWYGQLAYSLCDVGIDVIHKEHDKICKMIGLLLSCVNKRMWSQGSSACCAVIYNLISYYPCTTQMRLKNSDRPLTVWNPLKDWGKLYSEKNIEIRWHQTDAEDMKIVSNFIAFMFEHMEKLKQPDKLSKQQLEKSLFIVRACYEQIVWNVGKPKTEGVASKISALPHVDDFVGMSKFVITMPDGSNVVECLLSITEKLLDFMLLKRPDDVDTLTMISVLISFIANPAAANKNDDLALSESVDSTQPYMRDRLTWEAMYSYCETVIFNEYTSNINQRRGNPYNKNLDRCVRMLCKLAVSRYDDVRGRARQELASQASKYRGAEITACQCLCPLLLNPKAEDEALAPVLEAVHELSLGSHDLPSIRQQMWSTILSMKELSLHRAREIYELLVLSILVDVVEKPYYMVDDKEKEKEEAKKDKTKEELQEDEEYKKSGQELDKSNEEWFAQLPKWGIWEEFKSEKGFTSGKKKWDTHVEECKKLHNEVVEYLKAASADTKLSPPRVEFARKLLLLIQKKTMDEDTIKLTLRLLLNDKEMLRRYAAETMSAWLKKNKPKTKRKTWKCPERSTDTSALVCGVRKDNVMTVYDSEKLPSNEKEWKMTIFLPKSNGVYKFPKKLKVCRPWSEGDPIERGPLSEKEKLIVEFFSKMENVQKMIDYLIIEKNDGTQCMAFTETSMLLKYLLRNFPNATAIFDNYVQIMARLLPSKKREEQSLALDLLSGVVCGTRHWSFARLQKLWSWLQPGVRKFIDRLQSEVEANWIVAASNLTRGWDLRQVHWFVEMILDMADHPPKGVTSRQLGIRFNTLFCLNWKHADITNRLVRSAWKCIPNAKLETDRVCIAAVFMACAQMELCHYGSPHKDVPSHLRPLKFEHLLQSFMCELKGVTDRLKPGTASNAQNLHQSIIDSMLQMQGVSKDDNNNMLKRRRSRSRMRFIGSEANSPMNGSAASSPTKAKSPCSPAVKLTKMDTTEDPLVQAVVSATKTGTISNDGKEVQHAQSPVVTVSTPPPALQHAPDLMDPAVTTDSDPKLTSGAEPANDPLIPIIPWSCDASPAVSPSPSDTNIAKIADVKDQSLIYLRTLVDILVLFYETNTTALNKTIIQTIPILLVFATDDESTQDEDTNIGEMRAKATVLLNNYMAPCYLNPKYVDELLNILISTYQATHAFRVRMAIIKFLQSSVVANYYIYCTDERRKKIRAFIMEAIADDSIEVCKASVMCLAALLQRTYLVADQDIVNHFLNLSSAARHDEHASEVGALGLCAIVHATAPGCHNGLRVIRPLLQKLVHLVHSPNYKIKKYCGDCLRNFRTGRREEWAESAELFGTDVAQLIEECGAPNYYA